MSSVRGCQRSWCDWPTWPFPMNSSHITPQTAQELTDICNWVWLELSFSVTLNPLVNIGEGFGHSKVFWVSVNPAGSSIIKHISFIEIWDSQVSPFEQSIHRDYMRKSAWRQLRFWTTKIGLVNFHYINSLYTLQWRSQIMLTTANYKCHRKNCILSSRWNVLHYNNFIK